MDKDVRDFGTRLGRKAIERDWNSVHGMLAPWLRKASPSVPYSPHPFFANNWFDSAAAAPDTGRK